MFRSNVKKMQSADKRASIIILEHKGYNHFIYFHESEKNHKKLKIAFAFSPVLMIAVT